MSDRERETKESTPEGRIREFNSLFTAARYVDAYGLTETCSGDTMMDAGRELDKIGSAGRPVAQQPELDPGRHHR